MPFNAPPVPPPPEPSPPPPPPGLMRQAGARPSNVVGRDPASPGPPRASGVDPCPRPLWRDESSVGRHIMDVVLVAAYGAAIVYALAQLLGR